MIDESDIELLTEMINKSLDGIPVHDENGSKNMDKALLLLETGFRFDRKDKAMQRNNKNLTLIEISNTSFLEITKIALVK